MTRQVLKWISLFAALALAGLVVSNAAMLGLNYASLETANKTAPKPAIEAASVEDWSGRKAALRQAFEEHVYGPWPDGLAVARVSRRLVDADYAGGRGRLEEIVIRVGRGDGARRFHLGLAVPEGEGPFPLIIGQTFAPNCYVFASPGLTASDGDPCESTQVPFIFRYIFGEYIARAPVRSFFERGFAYASFHASQFVPDARGRAARVLDGLRPEGGEAPRGTLSAWAYGYSAVIDALARENWLDEKRIAVFGHSRHGKAALVAAAQDKRIQAVISHQSGFGGAALSRSRTGETVARITSNYPHWFDPAYGRSGLGPDALPVDQHQLLALIAPRALFLGNARRDVWSDPNSTYRAAEAASPVWELFGAGGLEQNGMADWQPDARLAYWLRSGGHGTDQRDIDAILEFLDAHFAGRQAVACRELETASMDDENC